MDVSVYQRQEPHHHAFDEVVDTLRYGLKALAATGFKLPDRTIYLNAHLWPWNALPDDLRILYNFEQRESPALDNSALHVFRQHEVWDYSASNVVWLSKQGVRAKHVPIGYVPELKRIGRPGVVNGDHFVAVPDIDVLFYGLVNTRRRKILDDLKTAGLCVHEVVNCYGRERDALIGRSKIVLNMHFYETGIFEIVRCSYLFANEICVVSEESVDVPPELESALPFVPYEKLVDTCVRLARDTNLAKVWATTTHEAFRSCDEVSILRAALK